MSYVEEICLALIRVLEHASFHKGARLAGYAANVAFWAEELRHALDCIEGYASRFEKLKAARMDHASLHGEEAHPSWITPTVTGDELGALKSRLLAAATRFFRLCNLDRSTIDDIERLVGIRIENRSVELRD